MNVADAVAQILKAEGVQFLFAYPVNHLIEAAAKVDIRPVIVRQERIGLHMADAIGRLTSGAQVGVFAMQHGPGAENAFGGIAQAFGESSPVLALPMGYARSVAQVSPNFNAALNYRNVAKSTETLPYPEAVGSVMRRAFSALRNGRPRPAVVEIPTDLMQAELTEPVDYRPVRRSRYGPDPEQVSAVATALLEAKRPVIYAGQGVHYGRAWAELRDLAELLKAPVTTTLSGKSAFPENHPLYLGCANRSHPQAVMEFLRKADLIFGIGCSFSTTSFGIPMPKGTPLIHASLDPADLHKDVTPEWTLVGDAQLTIQALLAELRRQTANTPHAYDPALAIAQVKASWQEAWRPKLTSDETPLSPYRVIWELMHAVDVHNTIITHDAGSPRDQLAPFWEAAEPLSYIGWGKTTQLGYGLGLAMGAKLLHPNRLCINVWGDAAIGFTGMDFETAVRERIPILSVLLNNFSMAIEIPIMQVSTAKYGSTNISGNYAAMAQAFGGYGERVTAPEEIGPALQRGIEQTRRGTPALLEFITAKETDISKY